MNWFTQNNQGCELHENEPLSRHTYYHIGGPAKLFAVPKNQGDLQWLSKGIQETNIPVFILGNGSNLLVSDYGFDGLVIHTHKLNTELWAFEHKDKATVVPATPPLPDISPLKPIKIRTGGSVSVPSILRQAMQEGWGGFEFLCGIPGIIGGAIAMNAGTKQGEVKDRILRVEAIPLIGSHAGEHLIFEKDQLSFSYRCNHFLPPLSVVWAAEWESFHDKPEIIRKELNDALTKRKETQPINFPSCGSVFKNPKATKDYGKLAWQVMEEIGLKGHREGNAQVSVKHGNFIVNLGEAKAQDVYKIIRMAQKKAKDQLNITLELEVKLVGVFDEPV